MNRYLLKETRHGRMLFDADDTFIGKSFEHYGEYSWMEAQLMLDLLTPESVVVEAGCHIGSFTVPMAMKCATLYAFEPQRLVFQMLCANLALNGLRNVYARQAALSSEPGKTLCPHPEKGEFVNTGGVTLKGVTEGEEVPVWSIDQLNLPRLDLIRADIEDMEHEMIVGARGSIELHRPVVYLESNQDHDPLLQEMFDLRYDCYWHFPYLFNPENYDKTRENVFLREHKGITYQTVTYNLLCLPQGSKYAIEDGEIRRARLGDKCGEVCESIRLRELAKLAA